MATDIVRQSLGLDDFDAAPFFAGALLYVTRFAGQSAGGARPPLLASILARYASRGSARSVSRFHLETSPLFNSSPFRCEPLSLVPRLRSNSLSASTAGGLVAYRVDQVRYFFYSMRPAALFGLFRYIALAAVAAITMIAASPASADVCTGNVFTEAAALYQLDPDLLRAITWVESHGQPGAVGPRLADGHRAWGAAQINDVHLPELVSYGVTQRDLLDPCINLRLSAWVLANCIRAKGPTWAAVGCYNTGPGSRNTAAQARYVRLVQHAYAGYRAQSAAALHDGRGQK